MESTRESARAWSSGPEGAVPLHLRGRGLLAVFVVFVILYMAGVDQWVCIAFGVAAASVLVWLTFRLNARYGEHGLMKLLAARRHPRYLLNRKSLRRLLKRKGAAYEKPLESHHAGKQVPAPGRGRRLYHQQGRDITVVYRVELPELFTVTSAEYEAIHAAWCKALKVLPEYSVVTQAGLVHPRALPPATGEGDMSFLSRSYERHFNERPFLTHACFLYLTKTTRERMHMRSDFSTLCRGNIIPKEVNRESATKFLEAAEQFERILNDSGFLTLVRLTGDEITGYGGLFRACWNGTFPSRSRRRLLFRTSSWGPRFCAWVTNGCACTRSRTRKTCRGAWVRTPVTSVFPPTVRTACCRSRPPWGFCFPATTFTNQYVFLEDSDENLRMFEKRARNMQSLSRYSRGNQINKEWIDQYLNEAHSFGLQSVRAHFNVLAWSDDVQELRHIRNDVGSQLALMECRPRHNTVDAATLYWAGMPGQRGGFPAEESFYTFIEPAVCFFTEETNYKSSSSPFGIKLCDRVSGRPLHLDISDEPMKKGIITNRNKFVLGGSGQASHSL